MNKKIQRNNIPNIIYYNIKLQREKNSNHCVMFM